MLADMYREMLLLIVSGGVIAAAAPSSSCSINQSQGEGLCICTVSRSHKEFCSSGSCIYTFPPTFKLLLKEEACKVTWYNSTGWVLARPDSLKFEKPVKNISKDHLTTNEHVEGLILKITFNDEHGKLHYCQAVYTGPQKITAPPTTAGQPGSLPQSHAHIWIPVLGILAVCIFAVIYWKRNKSQGRR